MTTRSSVAPSRKDGRENQPPSGGEMQSFSPITAEDMIRCLDNLPEPRHLPASSNGQSEAQGEAASPMRPLDMLSAAAADGPLLSREMAEELVRELQPRFDSSRVSGHVPRPRTGPRKPRVARSTPVASPTSQHWPLLVPASATATQAHNETKIIHSMQPQVRIRRDNSPLSMGPGAGPWGCDDADPRRQRLPTNVSSQASQPKQNEQTQPDGVSKPVQTAVSFQKSPTNILQLQMGVLYEKRKVSRTECAVQKCTECINLMNQGASVSAVTGRLGVDSNTLKKWKKTLADAGCPVGSLERNELMVQQYEFLLKSNRSPYTSEQFRTIVELFEQGVPRSEVSRLTGVPVGTLATYKRRLREAGLPVRPKALH